MEAYTGYRDTPGALALSDGEPIERALVLVAHPDDIESWCAGTVARLTAAGAYVAFVVCTSGEKGTADRTVRPAALAMRREAEQREAARRLGVHTVVFLRHPDGELQETLALRGELARQIRLHRPDLVITHDPLPAYRLHPDHRMVGRVTLDAIYPTARDHLFYPEHLSEGLEPHAAREAWLFATDQPDRYVDIAATFERKIAARLAHTSQHSDAIRLRESFQRRAAEIGRDAGLMLAEAFKAISYQ